MKTRSGKLEAQTVAVSAISAADRERMWEVFQTYYADVSREMFDSDLAEKNHVFLLRDTGDKNIKGFSTVQVMHDTVVGKKVVAIFSGDTIVENEYWGQTALQKAFFRYILRIKSKNVFVPVYWFLISKGYKTYLLLSRNFPEHWPRHSKQTPPWQRAVLDTFAKRKFGDAWKSERGILQFNQCQGRLREGVAHIDENLLKQPDIKFFVEKNPHHELGDELCCLGKVDLKVASYYPLKLMRKKMFRSKRKSLSGHSGLRHS
jgi:hypothetical protein